MLFIENQSINPFFNLALEEYFLKSETQNETIFLLWRNEKTIVVGRNQNAFEEINEDFVRRRGINVVRRLTGGGAVYHDLGNLNYSFLSNDAGIGFDFSVFAKPIVSALKRWGIVAAATGRNDLTIDGRKFSGAAQVRYKNRLLHHGTLLFRTNGDDVQEALRVAPDKFQSKAVASIRSRVANVADFLPSEHENETIESLRELLIREVGLSSGVKRRELTEDERIEIERIRRERYETWDWNFGKSPKFNFQASRRFSWGKLDVRMRIENGRIAEATIFGDFFALESPRRIVERLIGIPPTVDSMRRTLSDDFLRQIIPQLTTNDFLDVFR